jgi:hypothetical protein
MSLPTQARFTLGSAVAIHPSTEVVWPPGRLP